MYEKREALLQTYKYNDEIYNVSVQNKFMKT